VAAQWLGLSQRAALAGALGAVLLPYGAWLSAATVPEAPTAALVLLGAASLGREETKLRAFGGLALGAACFCRYESWATALVFAAITAYDAARERRRELWWPVAFALTPIALWLLHGSFRHADALFFVARVRQYRAALGGEHVSLLQALIATPFALVRFEPELCAVALAALGLTLRAGSSPFARDAWRPVAALGALVLLLMFADATGGSATHHPERSLLPVFWFLALVSAGLIARLASSGGRWQLPAIALPLAILGNWLLRPDVRSTFVDRAEEEQLGAVLRRLDAKNVAIDTDDFGFFAVQAALGDGRSWTLAQRDPRKPDPAPATSPQQLADRLRHGSAHWLVTPRGRAAIAEPLGRRAVTSTRLCLFELDSMASGRANY
jgi:hypothetical protein